MYSAKLFTSVWSLPEPFSSIAFLERRVQAEISAQASYPDLGNCCFDNGAVEIDSYLRVARAFTHTTVCPFVGLARGLPSLRRKAYREMAELRHMLSGWCDEKGQANRLIRLPCYRVKI